MFNTEKGSTGVSYSTNKPWMVYKVFKYGQPSIDERTLFDFVAMCGKQVNASKRVIKQTYFLNYAKPRPIIARFLRYKNCEEILSMGSRLRGSTFRMYQDLPYEIVARRRKQMNTFREARKNNIPASFSRAQPDKLFIKGKLWPVGKPLVIPE